MKQNQAGPIFNKLGFVDFRGSISAANPLDSLRPMYTQYPGTGQLNSFLIKSPPKGLFITSVWWNALTNTLVPFQPGAIIRQQIEVGPSELGPWERILEIEFPNIPDQGGYWYEGPQIFVPAGYSIKPTQSQSVVAAVSTIQGAIKINIASN